MAAPTTIHALPDDMLHEIFGHVFAGVPEPTYATQPPMSAAHRALRCVCRRWSDIADWVLLSKSLVYVSALALADAGAIRLRHPAAFKRLKLAYTSHAHSNLVSRVASNLINGSADLRRALLLLKLETCCLPSLSPAVTTITSCTTLTSLDLSWNGHENECAVASDMLAPLSALQMLDTLAYEHTIGTRLPESALLAPLPALPDAPRLTRLLLRVLGNFVPVGSDAALGRLRRLDLMHRLPVQEVLNAEDPFLLRTAFDAGTWQPSRLTGLKELSLWLGPVSDSRAPVRPSLIGSRSGSEWAPLAGQVTSLTLSITSEGYTRPSTGIVAGLGVLTALRSLCIEADFRGLYALPHPVSIEVASIDRLQAPYLTRLATQCISTTVNVARFPKLVHLDLASHWPQPILNLRSLVARSSLKTLYLLYSGVNLAPSLINLAELFVGGCGWTVLERLKLHEMAIEWDETDLAGAPTAEEFAKCARQLLPALCKVRIYPDNELPDPSHTDSVEAYRRHVVPALLRLHTGGTRE